VLTSEQQRLADAAARAHREAEEHDQAASEARRRRDRLVAEAVAAGASWAALARAVGLDQAALRAAALRGSGRRGFDPEG
jgi:hypothetical protein